MEWNDVQLHGNGC